MGLMDLMNETTADFNPATDNAETNDFQVLPDGEYDVVLTDVGHGVTKSGWEHFRIGFEVLTGDEAGRTDMNMFNFDEVTSTGKEMPKSVLATRIKLIKQLAYVTDTVLQDSDWYSLDTLGAAFVGSKGKTFKVDFSSRENKKKPQYPYKNYNFGKSDVSADAFGGQEIEITDDDIPF